MSLAEDGWGLLLLAGCGGFASLCWLALLAMDHASVGALLALERTLAVRRKRRLEKIARTLPGLEIPPLEQLGKMAPQEIAQAIKAKVLRERKAAPPPPPQ